MSDFSFKRDFRYVNWKSTLVLNSIRAASAGLILGTCMAAIFLTTPGFGGEMRLFALAMPLIYAIVLPIGLPVYLLMAIVCGYLSEMGVPIIGWIPVFVGLMFGLGDPVLFFLHRSRPELVPLERPSLFNAAVIIFVVDVDRIPAAVRAA